MRECPVCLPGQGEVEKIANQRFLDEAVEIAHQVFLCNRCAVGFHSWEEGISPVNYEASDKYVAVERAHGAADTDWDASRIRDWVHALSSREIAKRTPLKVLDIGAGAGSTIQEIHSQLPSSLLHVFEPSKPATVRLREKLERAASEDPRSREGGPDKRSSGVTIHTSEDTLEALAGYFDLVTLNHVLEHVEDPRQTLQLIFDLLTPNGEAYIEVPDASRYEEFRQTPYHFFDREHINHFSPPSLVRLIENFNRGPEQQTLELDVIFRSSVRVSDQVTYPIVGMWLQKSDRKGIREYASGSSAQLEYELPLGFDSEQQFVVYGWGSFAQSFVIRHQLLKSRGFFGVVDSAESKWGNKVHGSEIRVAPPSSLKRLTSETQILVLSALYESQILSAIDLLVGAKLEIYTPVRGNVS